VAGQRCTISLLLPLPTTPVIQDPAFTAGQ
jgi:hypothetical protein